MALPGVAGATEKVAANCGSLRNRSAIEWSKGAVEIEEVGSASLPMLNTDLGKRRTFTTKVEAFRRKNLEADSILFASPEYNFSVTDMILPGSFDLNRLSPFVI